MCVNVNVMSIYIAHHHKKNNASNAFDVPSTVRKETSSLYKHSQFARPCLCVCLSIGVFVKCVGCRVSFSAVNASYLGKNGAVTILFKILALCQRKHLILLKHSLDTLGHLVKSSECHSELVS